MLLRWYKKNFFLKEKIYFIWMWEEGEHGKSGHNAGVKWNIRIMGAPCNRMLPRIIHSQWCKAASTMMQLSSSYGTPALSSGRLSSLPSSFPMRRCFFRKRSSDAPQSLSPSPNLKRLTLRIVELTHRRQLGQVVCLLACLFYLIFFSIFFSVLESIAALLCLRNFVLCFWFACESL